MNKPFRNKYNQPRLSKEEAERQGLATRCAWESFPEQGEAIAFLNAHDDELGGRPIDLAIASASGLAAVEQAIAARNA
jgi:hypothetical protein